MTGVAKGIWIAVANVLVIAIALAIEVRVREAAVVMVVVAAAIVPAVFLGGVLGRVAEVTAGYRPVWRVLLLGVPACSLVVWLANEFDLVHFVPHACIPTLVAASILERITRTPKVVPVAKLE